MDRLASNSVLPRIFSYLEYNDVISCRQVCREFNSIIITNRKLMAKPNATMEVQASCMIFEGTYDHEAVRLRVYVGSPKEESYEDEKSVVVSERAILLQGIDRNSAKKLGVVGRPECRVAVSSKREGLIEIWRTLERTVHITRLAFRDISNEEMQYFLELTKHRKMDFIRFKLPLGRLDLQLIRQTECAEVYIISMLNQCVDFDDIEYIGISERKIIYQSDYISANFYFEILGKWLKGHDIFDVKIVSEWGYPHSSHFVRTCWKLQLSIEEIPDLTNRIFYLKRGLANDYLRVFFRRLPGDHHSFMFDGVQFTSTKDNVELFNLFEDAR